MVSLSLALLPCIPLPIPALAAERLDILVPYRPSDYRFVLSQFSGCETDDSAAILNMGEKRLLKRHSKETKQHFIDSMLIPRDDWVNTPPQMVHLDRTNGARRPLEWCTVTAAVVQLV